MNNFFGRVTISDTRFWPWMDLVSYNLQVCLET
jgi:hypothetical protein